MPDLIALFLTITPALPFLVLPFVASTLAALGCAAIHARLKRLPKQEQSAGPWLRERTGLIRVAVGVAPEIAGSMDGYWPESRFIGLSPRTWVDRSPAGRVVAAHELGHATAWHRAPLRSRRLGILRRVHSYILLITGAGVLTAAMTASALAATVGMLALCLSGITHLAVLADEADASLRGSRFLEREGARSRWTDLAMVSAWAVYLAPLLVNLGLIAASPWLLPGLLEGSPVASSNSALALWAVLLLSPFLALRAAQVLAEATHPVPVQTEFRLNWTLSQERTWEFHSGAIVLVWMALTYDQPVAQGLAPLFLLGAIPIMGPLGALGRLVVVLPIFFLLALFGVFDTPLPSQRSAPNPVPKDPLEVIHTDSPWTARASGLLGLAWLPLGVALVTRAISGW